MKRTRLMLLSLFVLTACVPEGPRELKSPSFNADSPFPELGIQLPPVPVEMELELDLKLDGESSSATKQLVPLAGQFLADVPKEYSRWRWGAADDVVLITHAEAGEAVDALLYAEAIRDDFLVGNSSETRRFIATVDPGLNDGLWAASLIFTEISGAISKLSPPSFADLETLGRAGLKTLGRGLGYTSTDNSFSGWRWVGKDDATGLTFRVARSQGKWVTGGGMKEEASKQVAEMVRAKAEAALPDGLRAAEQLDALERLVANEDEKTKEQTRSAYQVIGSIRAPAGNGVHFAIVCALEPDCATAEDFAEILASVRPSRGAAEVGSASDSLGSLADEYGLFVMEEDLVDPEDFDSLMRKAAEAKEKVVEAASELTEGAATEDTPAEDADLEAEPAPDEVPAVDDAGATN